MTVLVAIVLTSIGCQGPAAPLPVVLQRDPSPPPVVSPAPPAVPAAPAPVPPAEREDPPPPRGFEPYGETPFEGPIPERRCGRYRILQTRAEISPERPPRLWLLGPDGRTAWSRQGDGWMQSIDPAWCFDVTGDGVPELLVVDSSAGTHCCNEELLLSLGDPVRTELVYEDGGKGGGLTPVDHGGAAPYPLLAYVDAATADGESGLCLSHAERPFFPILFARAAGRWGRAGAAFAGLARTARDDSLRRLEAIERRRVGGPALGAAGASDEDTERDDAAERCMETGRVVAWSELTGDWRAVEPRVRTALANDPILEGLAEEAPRYVRRRLARAARAARRRAP